MAVSTYALTSLSSLKTSLGLSALETDKDAILEDSIDRATSIIESFVDRKLKSRTHYEWVQPSGDRSITLDNPPIRTIDTISFGRQDALVITSDTASSDVLATVGFDGSEVRLRKVAANGTATTATLAADTYPTTASLVTQINASVAGWSATLTESAYTRSFFASEVAASRTPRAILIFLETTSRNMRSSTPSGSSTSRRIASQGSGATTPRPTAFQAASIRSSCNMKAATKPFLATSSRPASRWPATFTGIASRTDSSNKRLSVTTTTRG